MKSHLLPAVAIGLLLIYVSSSFGANSVIVESVVASYGSGAVSVGVYIENDVDVAAIVIPLELRSTDSTGFIADSLTILHEGRLSPNTRTAPARCQIPERRWRWRYMSTCSS